MSYPNILVLVKRAHIVSSTGQCQISIYTQMHFHWMSKRVYLYSDPFSGYECHSWGGANSYWSGIFCPRFEYYLLNTMSILCGSTLSAQFSADSVARDKISTFPVIVQRCLSDRQLRQTHHWSSVFHKPRLTWRCGGPPFITLLSWQSVCSDIQPLKTMQ